VLALDGVNGTRVTGAVPDVRPWLAGADLVVVPLTLARGVQNKVLEAMAMARPVLLTAEAATGIDAVDGRDFAVSPAAPEEFAARAVGLLSDPIRADGLGAGRAAFVIALVGIGFWRRCRPWLVSIVGLAAVRRDGFRSCSCRGSAFVPSFGAARWGGFDALGVAWLVLAGPDCAVSW
jgi:hypothetical protein